jgi:hypothetical protein
VKRRPGPVSCIPLDYGQRLQWELVSYLIFIGQFGCDHCCGLVLSMWCYSYIKRVETCQSVLCRLHRYWDCETYSDRKRENSKQRSRLCGSANSNIRLVYKMIAGFIGVLQRSLASFAVFLVFSSKTSSFNFHNRLEAGVAYSKHIWISVEVVCYSAGAWAGGHMTSNRA